MTQTLSSKEQSLFRTVVKNYESKQYKKGVKSADQILRKNPNHGETQAMKALLINSLGQSEEAFTLAKVALKSDMKSHVTWHVYGLLWRSVRNCEEAIKAYKFALKLAPDSPQILRDLALLQIQMRDYQGYIQSRKAMLQAKPAVRQNWTAMAIAHHLSGDHEAAEKVLKTYEDTLKVPPSKRDTEHAEAILYKNTIIAESGDTDRALTHLDEIKSNVLDREAVMELRAQYLLKLDRNQEAEQAYRDLLDRNGEYRAYYEGLEKALGLTKSDKQPLKELYGSYAQKHDRLDAARRIPLDFLDGDDFREAADHYLRRMLRNGVPSVFNNVKSLYSDSFKRDTIQELVEGYAKEPQVNGSADPLPNGDHSDRFHESTLYFLAQHYNYHLSRDLNRAMELTEQLIQLSPKTYDYTMNKARILKHLGNPVDASKVMNQARELDLKDRYINTKCAKYQLRNNENDNALKTMSKFTKNDQVGGTLGDLHEMQSLWYITEDGEAHWRQGRLGQALKRFHAVYDIFTTWEEDQFDFHGFSLRKGQIRAYIDMVRWEDNLRDHPFYSRAAIDAIKLYLLLFDNPELAQAEGLPTNFSSLDDGEKKKILKKAKKEQEKRDKEDAERREADKKAATKKGNLQEGEVKKIDRDPRGKNLVETKEPLEAATKFLHPLLEFGSRNSEAQHVGFEVFARKRKHYLALKCVLAAFNINPSDPTAHEQAIRLRHLLNTDPTEASPAVTDLANSLLPEPYNDASAPLATLNDNFLAKHPNSIPHLHGFLRARQLLDPSSKSKNQDAVLKSLDNTPNVSLQEVLASIQLLRELDADTQTLDALIAKAEKPWPQAKVLFSRASGKGEGGATE